MFSVFYRKGREAAKTYDYYLRKICKANFSKRFAVFKFKNAKIYEFAAGKFIKKLSVLAFFAVSSFCFHAKRIQKFSKPEERWLPIYLKQRNPLPGQADLQFQLITIYTYPFRIFQHFQLPRCLQLGVLAGTGILG